MSTATLEEEVKQTHADRPHARGQLPFRIVNKGRFNFLEWDSSTIGPRGAAVTIPFNYPIEESPGQLGMRIAHLQERCAEAEATEDGYLAKIDGLVTDKVELQAQVKSLLAKVAEAQRQLETAKSKNGKRE